jgi:hypothetical protein
MKKRREESLPVTHEGGVISAMLPNTQKAPIPRDPGVVLSAQGSGSEERKGAHNLLCRIQLHGVTQEADIIGRKVCKEGNGQ